MGQRLVCCVLLLAGALVHSSAFASLPLLNDFFANTQTLKATFTQKVVDESGMTLDSAGGTLYLSRPGKFRWDYFVSRTDSALSQQILADGKSIYVYDPELEQVTQRSMDNALVQIPSLSLVASKATLNEHFELIDVGLTDNVSWVILRPKSTEAGFTQLMIGFSEDVISHIILFDALGNETRLQLHDVQSNAVLASDTFDFDVPEGTDILSQ